MAGTVISAPSQISLRLGNGSLSMGTYTGSGGNAAPDTVGIQVDPAIAANSVAQLQFPIPATAPSGTLNLRCVMVTDDTTTAHSAKFTISDAAISAGTAASGATLTAESQTTMHPSATPGAQQVTDVPLTTAPTADQFLIVAVTFNNTGWTVTDIATFQFFAVWK